ncbi:Uncharacterised protein [Leminorella richardii]|uniref:Uncharacterized protein n=1 Tax=Leminorella richardii TaxID=158841 RepID=A0A2X4X8B4_9GAMM|nr:hypothetical protein [Leminorella richardii]SQI35905.1 Uncharacterised protein [Leminorella richardii]
MLVLKDLFIGWRSGTMGRVKFGIYTLAVVLLQILALWYSLLNLYSTFAFWLFCLATIIAYYSGFLLLVKRWRELVPYPVLFALASWGMSLISVRYQSMLVATVSCIILLLLVCLPARRGKGAESR